MGAFAVDVSVTKSQDMTVSMSLEAANLREAEALALTLVRNSLARGGTIGGSAMISARQARYTVHTAEGTKLDD